MNKLTDEAIHVISVRHEILNIMSRLRFLDLSAYSREAAQQVIKGLATGTYGLDVARIAAERVIDCLMWL